MSCIPRDDPKGRVRLRLGRPPLGRVSCGLLAEAAARLWERTQGWCYYSPYNVGPVRRGLAVYRDSYEFGYEPTPNFDGHNSLGFKNDDYPPLKRRGVFRVMLAGDSLAEAYGDVLRLELERLMPPGHTLELWNIGVGGYNLSQYVRRLRRRGMRYEPDLVILFHCLNDLDYGVPVRATSTFRGRACFGPAPRSTAWRR